MLGSLALALSSVAVGQDRPTFSDHDTQSQASDSIGALGPDLLGDGVDFYTGAAFFSVTDVSLPGNSDLRVAVQRTLDASDDGIERMLSSYPEWSNFDVPYLSGLYKNHPRTTSSKSGWRGRNLHDAVLERCSLGGSAPDVPQSSGKADTWEAWDYWHGVHLYLPGGEQHPMAVVDSADPANPTNGATYHWTTKNNWAFSCLPQTSNAAGGEGFLGIAPDGTKYYFDWLVEWRNAPVLWKSTFDGSPTVLQLGEFRMLVTRVEDRFGNWVTYSYSGKNLTGMTANDGRQLTLSYDSSGERLASVTDGTRTWSYSYPTNGVQVTFPDATTWRATVAGEGVARYEPSSCTNESLRIRGSYTLTIEHRSGAVGTFAFAPLRRGVSYTYRNSAAPCPNTPRFIDNIALQSKTLSGPGLTAKTWSITYGPPNGCYDTGSGCAGSPTTRYIDVAGPESTFNRYTFGNKYQDTDGALVSIQTGTSISNILRDVQLTYETVPARGVVTGGGYLAGVHRLEETRTITQGGTTYTTTQSAWDEYKHPQTIVESGPNGGARTTQFTYYNNKSKWVIGRVATANSPGNSLSRSFDANANVASETRNGVATGTTYHGDGNVATITYPRSLLYSFSNYKRGIAQSESQPEGINLTRVVNDAGFITSETNGEQKIVGYGRDAVGRLTSIDYPRGNDSSIGYSDGTKSVRTTTRGSLVETVQHDALWRPITITRAGIATTYEYDIFGNITFESDPGSTAGTRYEYDALRRLTRVTHSDSSYRSIEYPSSTRVVRDERGKLTTYTYRAYGSPEQALLIGITAPEATASVGIERADNGLVKSVTQAGRTRSLGYDTRHYIVSETHPETGTTTYERDAAGNMTARLIGSSRTDFAYDDKNRLEGVTYSDSTPSFTQTWSKTGKLRTVTSSVASRVLDYDANDNLTSESITVGGTVLTAGYGYDNNDQLSTVTYPVSQRVVSYAPDALGRPTSVSGYATSVTYWPSGMLHQINYANGISSSYEQNSRLWPSSFATRRGGVYLTNSAYGYDYAGNLTSITDSVDATMNRSLGYDDIDRLTRADGPWGNGSIGYDGAGNIGSQSLGSFNLSYAYDTQNRLSSVSGSRSASYGYDINGNVSSASGVSYVYDAASNLTCANCSAGGNRTDYAYDGLSQRVTVSKSGTTHYEFHATHGDLLVEYTPSLANKLVEYIYLGGKRIAQRVSDTHPPTPLSPARSTVPITASGSATLTVNVGNNATSGTVTFYEGGNVIGTAYVVNGQASIDVLGLALGRHTITATYSGGGAHSGNSVTFQINVTNLAWLPAVLELILN